MFREKNIFELIIFGINERKEGWIEEIFRLTISGGGQSFFVK